MDYNISNDEDDEDANGSYFLSSFPMPGAMLRTPLHYLFNWLSNLMKQYHVSIRQQLFDVHHVPDIGLRADNMLVNESFIHV